MFTGAAHLSTVRPDADEVAGSVSGVLRVGFADDAASAIEQDTGLGDGGNVALSEGGGTARAVVDVTLGPRVDGGGTACELLT